jgi:hypothetical protein
MAGRREIHKLVWNFSIAFPPWGIFLSVCARHLRQGENNDLELSGIFQTWKRKTGVENIGQDLKGQDTKDRGITEKTV